jgi:hypothetical protein
MRNKTLVCASEAMVHIHIPASCGVALKIIRVGKVLVSDIHHVSDIIRIGYVPCYVSVWCERRTKPMLLG